MVIPDLISKYCFCLPLNFGRCSINGSSNCIDPVSYNFIIAEVVVITFVIDARSKISLFRILLFLS